uniref:6-cysteine protein n=1 Tax=Strongyloides papillosus TaxID=174720 RepID=A0A0N5BHC6_STREA
MFVQLYLLGTALALISPPIQPQGPHGLKLFPDIPQNIGRHTFPIDLEVKKPSDIVLVKCPDVGYQHRNTGDRFTSSNDVSKYKNLVPSNDSLFIWVPLLKDSSYSTQLNCGKIYLKIGMYFSYLIDWTYNVKWNVSTDDEMKINLNNMDFPLPETHFECHNETENLLIVSKDKENGTVVIINPRDVKNPYANQIFYYFIKPEQNVGRPIIEYCTRYKGYKNPPHFNLPDYSDNSITNEVKKIIISESNYEKEEKIKVNLKLGDDIQFYRDEEISLSRMRYTENGLIDIKNSTEQIKSSFVIKGFDLVKLVYNHLNATGYKKTSQIYYFGPALKNFTHGDDFKEYFYPYERPSCPIYFMNVGYLDKIVYHDLEVNVGYLDKLVYNDLEVNVSTLNSTDDLKRCFIYTLDSLFFKPSEYCDTFLHPYSITGISCIYKTLDGTITTSPKERDLYE